MFQIVNSRPHLPPAPDRARCWDRLDTSALSRWLALHLYPGALAEGAVRGISHPFGVCWPIGTVAGFHGAPTPPRLRAGRPFWSRRRTHRALTRARRQFPQPHIGRRSSTHPWTAWSHRHTVVIARHDLRAPAAAQVGSCRVSASVHPRLLVLSSDALWVRLFRGVVVMCCDERLPYLLIYLLSPARPFGAARAALALCPWDSLPGYPPAGSSVALSLNTWPPRRRSVVAWLSAPFPAPRSRWPWPRCPFTFGWSCSPSAAVVFYSGGMTGGAVVRHPARIPARRSAAATVSTAIQWRSGVGEPRVGCVGHRLPFGACQLW